MPILLPSPFPESSFLPDTAFILVTFLLLLASWGLIAVCERLMEDSK